MTERGRSVTRVFLLALPQEAFGLAANVGHATFRLVDGRTTLGHIACTRVALQLLECPWTVVWKQNSTVYLVICCIRS